GLSDQIRFLGFIEDVDRLLHLSDIHCAPSVWEEPLANTALEAKRAGVPSVLFPSGGLPELVVEHGKDAYLCPIKSAEALEAGIQHYLDLDDDELAMRGRAASASLSILEISREAFTRAWASVYAEL
ncbi:MAG: glycosyltransferase family 4 protein, partial [Bacteroidota bacterium]